MNWNEFSAISTAITAVATFFAAGVALWIACTEHNRQDNHRKRVLKSQKCDLILVPTKEWDSGAHYQLLIGELNGLNRRNEAAQFAINNPGHPGIEIMNKQADYEIDYSIEKAWFNGTIFFLISPDLFWIESERIYGVNIKSDKTVADAMNFLIGTKYFKTAFITTKGKKHDKRILKIHKLLNRNK